MSKPDLQALVLVLFLFYLLPFVLSQIVVCGALRDRNICRARNVWIALLLNVIINGIVVLALTCTVFLTLNPFAVCSRILQLQCSYTDIARVILINAVSIFLALLLSSVGCRIFLARETALRPRKLRIAVIALLIIAAVIPWSFGIVCYTGEASALQLAAFCRKTEIETEDPDTHETERDDYSWAVIRNNGLLTVENERIFLGDNPFDSRVVPLNVDHLSPGDSIAVVMNRTTRLNVKRDGGSTVYLSNSEGEIVDRLVIPALAREEIYLKTGSGWQTVPSAIIRPDTLQSIPPNITSADPENPKNTSAQKGGMPDYAADSSVF